MQLLGSVDLLHARAIHTINRTGDFELVISEDGDTAMTLRAKSVALAQGWIVNLQKRRTFFVDLGLHAGKKRSAAQSTAASTPRGAGSGGAASAATPLSLLADNFTAGAAGEARCSDDGGASSGAMDDNFQHESLSQITVPLSGWLKKLSPSMFARWQLRWFAVSDGILRYYKSDRIARENSNDAIGSVAIDSIVGAPVRKGRGDGDGDEEGSIFTLTVKAGKVRLNFMLLLLPLHFVRIQLTI